MSAQPEYNALNNPLVEFIESLPDDEAEAKLEQMFPGDLREQVRHWGRIAEYAEDFSFLTDHELECLNVYMDTLVHYMPLWNCIGAAFRLGYAFAIQPKEE